MKVYEYKHIGVGPDTKETDYDRLHDHLLAEGGWDVYATHVVPDNTNWGVDYRVIYVLRRDVA